MILFGKIQLIASTLREFDNRVKFNYGFYEYVLDNSRSVCFICSRRGGNSRLGHNRLGANMNMKKIILTACLTAGFAGASMAQNSDLGRVAVSGDDAPGSYVAGIWVDPDGCQHWVMDLGIEGMMDSVLTPSGSPVCGQGCGRLPGEVLFNTGSSQLTSGGTEAVQAVAMQLQSQGRGSVGVVGYTDATGSSSANQALSQNRAQAVANALRASGVNVTSVTGRGESNPVADNSTAAGRAENRRVELVCQ